MQKITTITLHLLAGIIVAAYVMPDGARWAATSVAIAAAIRLVFDLRTRARDPSRAAAVMGGGLVSLALGCSI